MTSIELGDRAKDKVTGFTGIATDRADDIASCTPCALPSEMRRCIKGAAIAFVLADAARERGDGEEAEQQEASAEQWCEHLITEARANIRAGRARLALKS